MQHRECNVHMLVEAEKYCAHASVLAVASGTNWTNDEYRLLRPVIEQTFTDSYELQSSLLRGPPNEDDVAVYVFDKHGIPPQFWNTECHPHLVTTHAKAEQLFEASKNGCMDVLSCINKEVPTVSVAVCVDSYDKLLFSCVDGDGTVSHVDTREFERANMSFLDACKHTYINSDSEEED